MQKLSHLRALAVLELKGQPLTFEVVMLIDGDRHSDFRRRAAPSAAEKVYTGRARTITDRVLTKNTISFRTFFTIFH